MLAYEGIKAEVLSGAFRPGERLESRLFETRFNTSSTTVRMALSRLAGERLIDSNALDGFHAPLITEAWLYDLFVANRELLCSCVSLARAPPASPDTILKDEDIVAGTEELFADIANATGNLELAALISSLNDRLRYIQRVESPVLPNRRMELQALWGDWQRGAAASLLERLHLYHQARIDHLRDIVAAVTRAKR